MRRLPPAESDAPSFVVPAMVGLLVLVVGGWCAWFLWTHECVESHREVHMRTSCSTTDKSTHCHTHPVTVTVCDQWVRR